MILDTQSPAISLTLDSGDGATNDVLFFHKGRLSGDSGNKAIWQAIQVTADSKLRLHRLIDRNGTSVTTQSKGFNTRFDFKKAGTLDYPVRMYSNKDSNILIQTSSPQIWSYVQFDWANQRLKKQIDLNHPGDASTITYFSRYNKHFYYKVIDASSDYFIYYLDLSTVGNNGTIVNPTWSMAVTNNETDFIAGEEWLYIMESGDLKLHPHGNQTPTTTYSSVIADTVVEMREIDEDDLFVRASGTTLYRITGGEVLTLSSALDSDTSDFRIMNKGELYVEAVDITQTPNTDDEHKDNWYIISETGEITAELGGVVQELCEETEISEDDINVSSIADVTVTGYKTMGSNPQNGFIEDLRLAYAFDRVESGGALKFVLRGEDPVETLDEDRLNATVGVDGFDQKLPITLESGRLIPREVKVIYLQPLRDYWPAEQNVLRQDARTIDSQEINLEAFAISDTVARQISERTLAIWFTERKAFIFTTSAYYFHIEPSDVITLTVGSVTHRIRITNTNYTFPGLIGFEGIRDDADDYNPIAIGIDGENGEQDLPIFEDTGFVLLDIPLIQAGDDNPNNSGIYIAVSPFANVLRWDIGEIYRKETDFTGVQWNNILTTSNQSVIGGTIATLASGTTDIIDKANSVTVGLFKSTDSLSSVTSLEMLNGANRCAIGTIENGFEILRFQTVTPLGGTLYTLSNFIRGDLGTEQLVGTHTPNDTFVLIDNDVIERFEDAISNIDVSFEYVGNTVGEDFPPEDEEDILSQTLAYESRADLPWSVSHETAVKDSGTNDITISWIRRTRHSGEWEDLIDVPLNEESEAYEADILDGSTVVRTLTSSSESVIYTSAQQTTDFGSSISTLNCNIYQISANFGRGFVKNLQITF